MANPLISVCIPAYKNTAYLDRLLNSLSVQTFRNFEVIVTDDSGDASVKELVSVYNSSLSILYKKNEPALGSPANWNKAISMARGVWIKIMHDDDWFVNEESLQEFANSTENTTADFIFSGFNTVSLITGEKRETIMSRMNEKRLRHNPLYLFRTNYIGHPSTTLIRNKMDQWFDERIKWVVDFEFYIRYLKTAKSFYFIRKPLINIGMGNEQITISVFRNNEVEIPENFYLLAKLGERSLKFIFVYDYYWRLLRNLKLRTKNELNRHLKNNEQPTDEIYRMLKLQLFFPLSVLRVGIVSKALMFCSWLLFRINK